MSSPVRPRGFTLIELLIGLALVSLLLGAFASLTQATLGSWRQSITALEATDEALIALDQMTRDIRLAGYDPRERGIAGLVSLAPDRITITADLDGDGRINRRSREHVSYRRARSSGDLLRVVGRQAMPLLTGLAPDGLRLDFLDAGGRPVDPAARRAYDRIRLVRITLTTGGGRVPVRVSGGARPLNR